MNHVHEANLPASDAADAVEEIAGEVKPWVERYTRIGYLMKGTIYGLLGLLILNAAWGLRSAHVEKEDVFWGVLSKPFGEVVVALIGLGLLGYVVWRFIGTLFDPEHDQIGLKGIIRRGGYLVSALGYAGLSFAAFRLLLGIQKSGKEWTPEDYTALLLGQPYGRWLVGLAGLVVMGFGVYQFYLAYKAFFLRRFKVEEMSDAEEALSRRVGQVGISARGVVYGLIGLFLFRAAFYYNSDEAGGLGDALQRVAQQPYGVWMLGLIGLGLMAYGVHAAFEARYRKISL